MAALTLFLTLVPPAVALYSVMWIVYARWFHPCSRFPGPFLASISRVWYLGMVLRAKVSVEERELYRKYGPIVRIAPDQVVMEDPDALKTIYGLNSGFTKSKFYEVFTMPWERRTPLFTTRNERIYAERRRIVNHVYSMTNVVRAEPGVNACLDIFRRRMHELAASGQPTDLSVWVRWYAFDVVGELFFSRQFGFLETKGDPKGWIQAGDTLSLAFTLLAFSPAWARPVILLLSAMVPKVLKGVKSLGTMEVAAEECIRERRELLEKSGGVMERVDMLASFIKIMEEKGTQVDYGPVEVKSEIHTALIVGSDTTSTAITAIMYFLMKNPDAYRTLLAELDEATASGKLSVPHVQYSEAARLPYLDACCKEGMRLVPSLGMALPRNVPPGGRQIAGEFFPEGITVGISAPNVHRSKEMFGENADEFDPERWFRRDAVTMEKHMLHFGMGARTCIGKHIALCIVYKIVPELVRSFDLELADPDREWTITNRWLQNVKNVQTRVAVRKTE